MLSQRQLMFVKVFQNYFHLLPKTSKISLLCIHLPPYIWNWVVYKITKKEKEKVAVKKVIGFVMVGKEWWMTLPISKVSLCLLSGSYWPPIDRNGAKNSNRIGVRGAGYYITDTKLKTKKLFMLAQRRTVQLRSRSCAIGPNFGSRG